MLCFYEKKDTEGGHFCNWGWPMSLMTIRVTPKVGAAISVRLPTGLPLMVTLKMRGVISF